MIKSMTGFGRWEEETKDYKITVEIKSVNHRYCDMNIKLPKKFNAFENKIRNIMKKYVNRGKIDIFITFTSYTAQEVTVNYHKEVAKEYVDAIREAKESFSIEEGLTAASLIRYQDVITLEENTQDMESFYPMVEQVLLKASEQFLLSKESEGKNLLKDILAKLDYISELISYVEKRSPETVQEYQNKIIRKVEELLGDKKIDDAVLATEMIVYADKICVDEETVRLRSHIENMRDTLKLNEAVGRKLDFIAQEMNREANTILSKANDGDLSQNAIDLKTEIEKIREQIQNIE